MTAMISQFDAAVKMFPNKIHEKLDDTDCLPSAEGASPPAVPAISDACPITGVPALPLASEASFVRGLSGMLMAPPGLFRSRG